MKLTLIRPIVVDGKVLVEGETFETLEQHGRELVKKGYAVVDDSAITPDEPEPEPEPIIEDAPTKKGRK